MQYCKAASQIHMACRIKLNRSLSFNANRQNKQIHPSRLFSFQVQETDVFHETCLERWQTDAVIDKDIHIEWISIGTEPLSSWDVVNSSISIHHTTSLSAVGNIIYFLWNWIKSQSCSIATIWMHIYGEMYRHTTCTLFDSMYEQQHGFHT